MTVNPKYNIQCNTGARNCNSGCCDIYRNCALSRSQCQYRYYDYLINPSYYYQGHAHSFCNLDALNCISGCCTFTGKCANTSSTCFYQYDNFFSNYSYYFPGDVNANNNTNRNNNTNGYNPYYNYYSYNTVYQNATAVSVGVTVGYLVLFVIGLIFCYLKRKPFVQAINRFATHDTDGNLIIYDLNLPQPKFGIDPTCLQPPTNPTYPGQLQQNHNPTPNKNAVLPLDTSINSLNNSFNRMFQNKQ